MRVPVALPDILRKNRSKARSTTDLKSMYRRFHDLDDARRPQGRRHRLPTVMSTLVAAKLASHHGPVTTAEFAAMMIQNQIRAADAWRNPKTGSHEPLSKSTVPVSPFRTKRYRRPGD